MARDVDALVELQQVLEEAETARRQLEGVPDSMRETHDQYLEHRARIETLEAQILADETSRRAAEAAAEAAQSKLDHYLQQVNRVTTQREYGSLLTEIDTVKAEISSHEEEALGLIERTDAAQGEIETQKGEFSELDSSYQKLLAAWEQEKPSVAARLNDVTKEIERLQESIPRHLVAQFERLYERHGGHAFAAVTKVQTSPRAAGVWHCSVCNYSVRPQVIVQIKDQGSLIACESCHRFLHIEDPV